MKKEIRTTKNLMKVLKKNVHGKYAGVVIVIFEHKTSVEKFMNKSSLLQGWNKFMNEELILQKAPEPTDITWENLGIP